MTELDEILELVNQVGAKWDARKAAAEQELRDRLTELQAQCEEGLEILRPLAADLRGSSPALPSA